MARRAVTFLPAMPHTFDEGSIPASERRWEIG